ncbi:hypothetical protein SteCoe_17116 [Stentor coeruleus]|uniref:C2 domain-containing protein n=1 Tax=Stentor coeruleus TaxID=5963 RepID=A0A1R2BZP0_9CILI|nr:hypothetical protein SteCoe_17116 [Stentor coeruleus]
MQEKNNSRQRAISDYEFDNKTKKVKFTLKLIEGHLHINVARLGVMYPYAKVSFANESWKSEPSPIGGTKPKWNQSYSFSSSNQETVQIIICDKSIIFGECEVGRCTIHLNDVRQNHLTEWWDIMSPGKELAGAILLAFDFPQSESTAMHSTNNSWDLKMHHHVESSPIVNRVRGLKLTQISHRTPDMKKMYCSTEPDEICNLEQLKNDLIDESERIKTQELRVKVFLARFHEDNVQLNLEKNELNRLKEVLKLREETILREKSIVEHEKIELDSLKEEIINLKETLNTEYLQLKQEKMKVKAQKAVQDKIRKRVMDSAEKFYRQKEILLKCVSH